MVGTSAAILRIVGRILHFRFENTIFFSWGVL